jgi:hypothetical protein
MSTTTPLSHLSSNDDICVQDRDISAGLRYSSSASSTPGIRLVPYDPLRIEDETNSSQINRTTVDLGFEATTSQVASLSDPGRPSSRSWRPSVAPQFTILAAGCPPRTPSQWPSPAHSLSHTAASDTNEHDGRMAPQNISTTGVKAIDYHPPGDTYINHTRSTPSTLPETSLLGSCLTETRQAITDGTRQCPIPLGGIDEIDEADGAISKSPSITKSRRTVNIQPRRGNIITINADKTFTLVPLRHDSTSSSRSQSYQPSSHSGLSSLSYRAPPSMSASSTTASSAVEPHSDVFTEDRPISPTSTVHEASASPCSSVTSDTNWVALTAPSPTALTFGTGRVLSRHKITPPLESNHHKHDGSVIAQPRDRVLSGTDSLWAMTPSDLILAELPKPSRNGGLKLLTKPSLQSIRSYSSDLDTPNYQVHGATPEATGLAHEETWSSTSQDLGSDLENLMDVSCISEGTTKDTRTAFRTTRSASESSAATVRGTRSFRSQISRESLDLYRHRPGRDRSIGSLHMLRINCSRESLRRTASLISLSSFLTQETIHTVLASPRPAHLNRSISGEHVYRQHTLRHDQTSPTISHPVIKPVLMTPAAQRQDNGYHRHATPHTSYSGAPIIDISTRTYGHDHSLITDDNDEEEDQLADLGASRRQLSRRRLSVVSASNMNHTDVGRDSRTDNTNIPLFPSWARLYYGRGECKLLMPSSDSLYSAFVRDRDAQHNVYSFAAVPQPPVTLQPSTSHILSGLIPATLRSRVSETSRAEVPDLLATSLPELSIPPPSPANQPPSGLRAVIRKKTSSIWSPHLVQGRRPSKYSVWCPPHTTWPAEAAHVNGRERQNVLFIIGFIFPFG